MHNMTFLASIIIALAAASGASEQTSCSGTHTSVSGDTYNTEQCGLTCYDPCQAYDSRRLGTVWHVCNDATQTLSYTNTEPAQCACYDIGLNWCYNSNSCYDPTIGEHCDGELVAT